MTRIASQWLFVSVLATAPALMAGESGNLLQNAGFETGADPWRTLGKPRYQIVDGTGRAGGRGLRYHKGREEPGPRENSHFDQVVSVEPDALYVAGVWFKAEGDLRPVLRIAGIDWKTIALAMAGPTRDWQETRMLFRTAERTQVRFQIFAGSHSERRESSVGASVCDDAFVRKPTAAELEALRTCRVTVHADRVIREIDPLFFGVNSLFWIEDDPSRADGRIAKQLREMPCTLLRYPAGEAADNYHWKTHKLDNPKKWPSRETPENMDTDEFMAWCRQIGAEPIFVVNLESSYLRGNVAAGAAEAAEWVKYCRDKGYHVHYWEIGNETYLKGTYCPLTAKQYATAFVTFARAMKAADPSISIGAVGPMGVDEVAKIERDKRGPAWWPTVVATAGDLLGFAIVHRYYNVADYAGFEWHPVGVDVPIRRLRTFLHERYPGRRVPIALTEWNTWRRSSVTGIAQALVVAELVGRYLEAGVDMANFWPMRLTGKTSKFRSLLDRDTNEPRAPYHVMSLFASHLVQRSASGRPRFRGGKLVQAEASSVQVYTCAGVGPDGKSLVVFLLNKSLWPEGMNVALAVEGFVPAAGRAISLTAPEPMSENVSVRTAPLPRVGPGMTLRLPAHSLTVVVLQE